MLKAAVVAAAFFRDWRSAGDRSRLQRSKQRGRAMPADGAGEQREPARLQGALVRRSAGGEGAALAAASAAPFRVDVQHAAAAACRRPVGVVLRHLAQAGGEGLPCLRGTQAHAPAGGGIVTSGSRAARQLLGVRIIRCW